MRASLALVAALLAGCGTTVPLADRAGSGLTPGLDPGVVSRGGVQPSTAAPTATVVPGVPGASRAGQPVQPLPSSVAAPGDVPSGPVTVGFLTTDWSAAAVAAGLGDNPNIVTDPQVAFRALVKALNAKGGLGGRRVVPVFHTVNGRGNKETEFQAACSAFTQDTHVAVVVSFETQLDTLSSCLGSKQIAQLDTNEWQRTQLHLNRGYVMVNGLSMERQVAAVFEKSVASGWVTNRSKVGVLTDGCVINVQAYERSLLPRAKAAGVWIERFDAAACTGSTQDGVRGVQQAALKFRTDGVDRVMYVLEGAEAAAHVLMSQNADKQQWYPGYVLSSGAQLANFASYLPPGQLPQMHGVGWSPEFFDSIAPASRPAAQKAVQAGCLSLLRAGGFNPSRVVDRYLGLGSCDAVFLLQAALARTGNSTRSAALSAAVASLGTSYVSTTTPLGRTSYGGGRQDGAQLAAAFSFHRDCSCFRYDTAFQPA
jgi:hypothetical protein